TQGIHQINYFRIYDRWGQLIYETDNIYEGWNGTISGKMSNSDVFVYYVSATCSGGLSIMKTGNITLIR
ncbi:MAG: hypothetical protein HKN92_01040, partial [Chitinophagales bacterium]|nr:hypothetical protein [Chitinophagales bacterium]